MIIHRLKGKNNLLINNKNNNNNDISEKNELEDDSPSKGRGSELMEDSPFKKKESYNQDSYPLRSKPSDNLIIYNQPNNGKDYSESKSKDYPNTKFSMKSLKYSK
jgi:hypothetical protein